MSVIFNIKESSLKESPIILGGGNTVNITGSNIGMNDLDKLIKDINDNLFDVKEEYAEEVRDVVNMAKEELQKSNPNTGRLRNCINLLAPMVTIANGVPIVAGNLQKFLDYIKSFISRV